MVICCIKSNQWDEWEQIRRWGRVAAEPSAGSHSLTLFSVCQTVVDIIVVAFLMLKLWQQLLPPDTGVQLMIIIFFFVISHIIMREMPTVITQSPMSRFQIAQMYLIYYHVRPGKAAHPYIREAGSMKLLVFYLKKLWKENDGLLNVSRQSNNPTTCFSSKFIP